MATIVVFTIALPEDCWAHILGFACCKRPGRLLFVSKMFGRCLDQRIGVACLPKVHCNDNMWVGRDGGPCLMCSVPPNKNFLDRTLKTMRILLASPQCHRRILPRAGFHTPQTYVHFSDAGEANEKANAFACYLRWHAHGIYFQGFCCGGKGVSVRMSVDIRDFIN